MPRERSPDLTERERSLLRRVRDHQTSKEIARATGLSERQVNRSLDAARVKLGAAARTKAALLLARMEEGERSPGEPLPLSDVASSADDRRTGSTVGPHVEEEATPFLHQPLPQASSLPGDRHHDLTSLLTRALKLALLILAGVILAIVVLRTFSEAGRPHLTLSSP